MPIEDNQMGVASSPTSVQPPEQSPTPATNLTLDPSAPFDQTPAPAITQPVIPAPITTPCQPAQNPYAGAPYAPNGQPNPGQYQQQPYNQQPYAQQPYAQPQGYPPYAPNGQFAPGGYPPPNIHINMTMPTRLNSSRSRIIALVLCLLGFVGLAGLHRFYAGKIGSGILWLLTFGFGGIGTLIDMISILTNTFADSNGCPIVEN